MLASRCFLLHGPTISEPTRPGLDGLAIRIHCITSNHVHLLLDAEERMEISGLMRTVAGEFARAYNRPASGPGTALLALADRQFGGAGKEP
jgi:REP element-mobilizing transposase RayT